MRLDSVAVRATAPTYIETDVRALHILRRCLVVCLSVCLSIHRRCGGRLFRVLMLLSATGAVCHCHTEPTATAATAVAMYWGRAPAARCYVMDTVHISD